MKKINKFYPIAILCCFLGLLLILSDCKKPPTDNTSNNNGNNNGNTTPAYTAPTQPGYIATTPSALLIKTGNSATLSAKLYNSDGTVNPSQPAFIYSSLTPSIVTVSGGSVTGVMAGTGTVAVTDGSHGFNYVTVKVMDSVPATNPSFSINFTPPILKIQKGSSASFSYKVYDGTGTSSSTSLQFFEANNATGITVTKGSITGINTGVYSVRAIDNSQNDTLAGSMMVIVSDSTIKSTNGCTGTDADWTTQSVSIINVPDFPKKGMTAEPLQVQVVRTSNCDKTKGVQIDIHQQSPDKIIIGNTAIASLNGSGQITSNEAGMTTVQASVGGVSAPGNGFILAVFPDLSGNWQMPGANGNSVFMSLNMRSDILYYSELNLSQASLYLMSVSGTACESNNSSTLIGSGSSSGGSYIDISSGVASNATCSINIAISVPLGSGGLDKVYANTYNSETSLGGKVVSAVTTGSASDNCTGTFTKTTNATPCSGMVSDSIFSSCIFNGMTISDSSAPVTYYGPGNDSVYIYIANGNGASCALGFPSVLASNLGTGTCKVQVETNTEECDGNGNITITEFSTNRIAGTFTAGGSGHEFMKDGTVVAITFTVTKG